MTYRQSEYGTERAARLIAMVREHLSPAEISDLIGTRSEPWERDWYEAVARTTPFHMGSLLRSAIEAYIDCGPGPDFRSAWGDDQAARKAA